MAVTRRRRRGTGNPSSRRAETSRPRRRPLSDNPRTPAFGVAAIHSPAGRPALRAATRTQHVVHRGGVFLRRHAVLDARVSGAQRGHALGPDRGPSSGRPRAERERRVLLRPDERAAPTRIFSGYGSRRRRGRDVDIQRSTRGDAAAATRIRSTIPAEGVHFGFAHRSRTSSRTRGRELCATLCPSRTCSTRPRRRNGGWGVVCKCMWLCESPVPDACF